MDVSPNFSEHSLPTGPAPAPRRLYDVLKNHSCQLRVRWHRDRDQTAVPRPAPRAPRRPRAEPEPRACGVRPLNEAAPRGAATPRRSRSPQRTRLVLNHPGLRKYAGEIDGAHAVTCARAAESANLETDVETTSKHRLFFLRGRAVAVLTKRADFGLYTSSGVLISDVDVRYATAASNRTSRFSNHQFSELPPFVEANLKTYLRQKLQHRL
ncbi:hypothetical protein EVAR_68974_1 [Eumeta japonica]|uniref:Uncharacterized protein n=1 Tax=Eumeta variegata TaxID=151549 RepID=A0A4C2A4L2_EUMVA|nr:hypothetical protein EVAR_68974_1 [Eumeta japonica]